LVVDHRHRGRIGGVAFVVLDRVLDRRRIARVAHLGRKRDCAGHRIDCPGAFASHHQRIARIVCPHDLHRGRVHRVARRVVGQHVDRHRRARRVARRRVARGHRHVVDGDCRRVGDQPRQVADRVRDRRRVVGEAGLRREGHVAQRVHRPGALARHHQRVLNPRSARIQVHRADQQVPVGIAVVARHVQCHRARRVGQRRIVHRHRGLANERHDDQRVVVVFVGGVVVWRAVRIVVSRGGDLGIIRVSPRGGDKDLEGQFDRVACWHGEVRPTDGAG